MVHPVNSTSFDSPCLVTLSTKVYSVPGLRSFKLISPNSALNLYERSFLSYIPVSFSLCLCVQMRLETFFLPSEVALALCLCVNYDFRYVLRFVSAIGRAHLEGRKVTQNLNFCDTSKLIFKFTPLQTPLGTPLNPSPTP